jgi:hypothetical protein
MEDPRIFNGIGFISIDSIEDTLEILKGMKTNFQKKLFLEEKLLSCRIEEGLDKYKDQSVNDIPYFWCGAVLAKSGQYSAPPDAWTEDAQRVYSLGVIHWDNYCQMKQWLIDIEDGKELRIGNDKPTAREILTTAHRENGGRLTSEQIKELAASSGLAEKYLLNKYSEIVVDLK